MSIPDGFAHQRLQVLPRLAVQQALQVPVTRRLVVTDAGYFPQSAHHRRDRPLGAKEAIVIVCTAGSGWVSTSAGKVAVGASTAAIIPAGTPHSYGSSVSHPWTIWWCHLRGTDVPELVEAIELDASKPVIPLRSVDVITAHLDEIITAYERDQSSTRLLQASGSGWKLLTQLAVDRSLTDRGEPLVRAMRYLSGRLDSSIKVSELAGLVGVSASHLSALFRAATGGGVLAHHTSLKMARARQLLDTTSLGIAEIGAQVGYTDQFYFSRQFRKVHGHSPSEYRAQRKG